MLNPSAPLETSRRRGAQPGNNNARSHGFYASRDPSELAEAFAQIRLIRQAVRLSLEAHQLNLAERFVQSLQEKLIENFLASEELVSGPDTHLKFDRFFRTVSAGLRAKRGLKKLRDELDFIPALARDALHLATLEFTEARISAFACYTANQNPPERIFVPHLLGKNDRISPAEAEFVLAQPQLKAGASTLEEPSLQRKLQAAERGAHLLGKNDRISPAEAEFVLAQPQLKAGASTLEEPSLQRKLQAAERGAHLLRKNDRISDSVPPPSLVASRPAVERVGEALCGEAASAMGEVARRAGGGGFSLTDAQWSLLEPILLSLRATLASMAIRVRDHEYSDRYLLECILALLAFSRSWDDMKHDIPVRVCQVLYRYLCTSGSMRAIYETLHAHLQLCGSVDLESMSRDESFEHDEGHIWLVDPMEPTWEELTGLLLLQRALFNRRRLKRAEARDRRRNGRFEREPRMHRRDWPGDAPELYN